MQDGSAVDVVHLKDVAEQCGFCDEVVGRCDHRRETSAGDTAEPVEQMQPRPPQAGFVDRLRETPRKLVGQTGRRISQGCGIPAAKVVRTY